MSFTEYKTVEKEILDQLQSDALGWRYEPGDHVTKAYRSGDEQEMLLIPILRRKLRVLNAGIITSDERADVIITKLRMIRDNREWLSWLRNEQTFSFAMDEKAHTIRLVDYQNAYANDFLCSNQVWIQGIERRRPDILLYLNGIPIVDIEAKTATRGYVDWAEGAKQCARYDREIPRLYSSNCFCVGVNELRMKYGVPGAPLQYWQQWRDPSPHAQIPSFNEMACSLFGLFDRKNLLDIIQNFIVFDSEEGSVVKKVARYQQFRAANKMVERVLAVDKPSRKRRGIVWHSQGSGKSLTMIFAARKLWNSPSLSQPTIVIVVDREQLEEQMAGELFRTNTENVIIAGSRRELRTLINSDYRGVILTLVHKFDEIEPAITNRSNVVMLVDEAHRSQYGDLGVFMRSALPNAAMFGLTGTPIELNDRNTPKSFGMELAPDRFERYMDRYSIQDAISDGATKPIHYEVRLTDWTVAHADLDAKFATVFGERTMQERKILLQEAKLDAVLKHPRRIAQVADDVAHHFVRHIRPNGFKAMLVCRDKEMCALYKVALDAALQAIIGADELSDFTRIVVSEDKTRDPESLKRYYLGDNRADAIKHFKKPAPRGPARERPENRFRRTEIVIVCDMLLTGFDAPIVQAMYLDKGMRDHTLLQAIARVNRPYDEMKGFGLILDYFGVFEDLNAALNFDKRELGEAAFPYQRFRDAFQRQVAELLALFEGIPRDGRHSTLMKGLIRLNDDDGLREEFERLFRNVRLLYETLQPDECLREYVADYTWLAKFYIIFRKKFYPNEHFEVSAEDGAKTRMLIRDHVDVKTLEADFPVYKLDDKYLTRIERMDPDAKALDIETMLDAELRIRIDEDEDVRPLSERLNRIIERKRAGTLAGIALLSELEQLTKQVLDVMEEERRPILESFVIEVKKRVPEMSDERAMEISTLLRSIAGNLVFHNWYTESYLDTEIYREFTILLATKYRDLPLHGRNGEFVDRCIRLLKKARFEG